MPSRAEPGRRPPSTRQPLAAPGRRAAEGALIRVAPCARSRRASDWQRAYVPGPPVAASSGSVGRSGGSCSRSIAHSPRRDTSQVLGVGDLLLTQELGPRSVRCVTEVVSRPFALRVPAPGRLRTTLPQKRIAGIGVAERDHVAGEETRAAARSRTRCGPGSSGCHVPSRSWAGERLSSSFRGRWNHRADAEVIGRPPQGRR